jgi:peptidoglycan/xylan/chitin deacetylase (PgdA/CDA1 family)
MKIRGLFRARRAAHWLHNQVAPSTLILMYHRVSEVGSDPFELAVTPAHFREQMEVLRRYGQPLRLRQLVEALRGEITPRRLGGLETLADFCRGDSLPRRSVVLTFDDGYADNLLNAKPILENYEMPATVFVTAGALGGNREFWWDELQRHVLEPGTLPETVHLDLPGEPLEFHLAEAATFSEADYEAQRHWPRLDPESAGPRQVFLVTLAERLRPLPAAEQRRALDHLAEWTGHMMPRPEYRQMTAEELHRLEAGGLVEIGAHTMTHPQLSAHPAGVQHVEILASRAGLQEILNHPVTNFAYPFGAAEHYNGDTVAILREAGFTSSVTTTPGLVQRSADRYRLPRHVVRDWDGETFARKLQEFYCG